MDAPKCRLCGTRHWPRSGCPGSEVEAPPKKPFPKPATVESKREAFKVAQKALVEGTATVVGLDDSGKLVPFRRRADNNTFDRKSYMREYMKDYRKRQKAKGPLKPTGKVS